MQIYTYRVEVLERSGLPDITPARRRDDESAYHREMGSYYDELGPNGT